MWHVDPLIDKNREINNYATAATKQLIHEGACFLGNNCAATEKRCSLRGPINMGAWPSVLEKS
jgi:hypothetical protein